MSLQIISRTGLTQNIWDELVSVSPDGWVFSLWGWQELILKVPKWNLKDHSFAVLDGGHLVAVVPLQYNAASEALLSSGWSGSGPVLSGSLEKKQRHTIIKYTIEHCLKVSERLKAKKLVYAASPVTRSSIEASWGVNPFEMCGMKDCSRLSQVIDLSLPENELWNGLSDLAKRKIRKAKASGFKIERTCWKSNVEKYYELHAATYLRTGEVPHPIEYFSGIANELSQGGYSVLWRALDENKNVCAYHNMARFKEGAYYHTGCSVKSDADLGVNYLLFWEAMLGARRMGVRWYDAGWIFPSGASKKQEGLSHFKTRFGGEVHRSFFAELCFHSSSKEMKPKVAYPSLKEKIIGRFLGK
jgi:hypothetical protein